MKWSLDFNGLINPPSSVGHKWILVATDYFTKWTKVVALNEANEIVVYNFYEDLIIRFGVPESIILNNALAFVETQITNWVARNGVYLNTSSNYYPQGNGQEDSTNKNLIKIIKRTIDSNQRAWCHTKLKSAL